MRTGSDLYCGGVWVLKNKRDKSLLSSVKFLFVIVLIWLLVPTGTPDDVVIVGIVALLGLEFYLVLLLVIVFGLWYFEVNLKQVNKDRKVVIKNIRKRMRL